MEDPHLHTTDDMFEAASFARDAYLETVSPTRKESERERAAAILKVLRWNGRLEEIVASMPAEEPKKPRRRRRSRGGGEPVQVSRGPVLPPDLDRSSRR